MKARIWASQRATGASHVRTTRQLKTTISLRHKIITTQKPKEET